MTEQLIDWKELGWIHKPSLFIEREDSLLLETEPHSSFHALSYDQTGACGRITRPLKRFAMKVRIDYRFQNLDDECGVLIKKDSTHWVKAGVALRDSNLDLACTLYGEGYGDRSCRAIGKGIDHLYFRIVYMDGNARFQYSFNGEKYSDMRWLHFAGSRDAVQTGIYACSPHDTTFDCTFEQFRILELQ